MSNKNNISKKNAFKNKLEVEPEKVKKKKTDSKPFEGFGNFFTDKKTHKVAGVFLALFALFLFFSFLSFLFTWWLDFDKLSQASFSDILFDESLEINNWTGRLGAGLAFLFVKE